MKKPLILSGALALSLGLMSADASAITNTVAINATVSAGCTANAPTGTTGFTINGISSTFATAVTGTTQAPASGTLTFGSLVCTTTSVRVSLASARIGLYVTGTEGNSSVKRMNYQALAKLNNTTIATLNTIQGVASQTGQAALPSTGTNNISVEISFPGASTELLPNGPLTAGTYSDTLTITIDGVV